MNRNVTEGGLKVCLVQKGAGASCPDTVDGLHDTVIHKSTVFRRDGIIDGVTARPGEVVNAAPFGGVFFGNGAKWG
jgi:hypothetical protein